MLGFFFRHYAPWVDRFVIYDDGSTDNSLSILRAHPKVEVRQFTRVVADSFVLSHTAMQDEVWKESRGQADWVVVTAIDEHLHVRGREMRDYLAEQARRNTTLIPALGFDMHHPEMPPDNGLLVETVTCGRARPAFNKLSIFDPNALQETGFGAGRHVARPVGHLHLPERDEVMLWHYKHLDFERYVARENVQGRRLGPRDRASGFGRHYLRSRDEHRTFWEEMVLAGCDLSVCDFEPERAAVKPLWWRTECTPAAELRPAHVAPACCPSVSVLIKTFNHAAYVRQTIESLLSQSFQDFEIVATDDGSTDETAAILRFFDDPRIRLEVLPCNGGVAAAMNATLARARGRYLAILNSDDWALPGRLRTQVAFLDANAEISLLFGLPQPVDETGQPTQAYNDFHVPFGLPDFSRRSWLRQFFFGGNCLCAPTAMIRREAYAAVGHYDPRLTNLSDLDMWIRMLLAGHRIHVLPEKLTALRIRDNAANASAPRLDNLLRTRFETTRILRHFASMGDDLYHEVFGDEALEGAVVGSPIALKIAELAARHPAPEHQIFAAETYHEHAVLTAELARLRMLTGRLEAFRGAAFDVERVDPDLLAVRRRNLELEGQTEDFAVTMAAQAEEIRCLRVMLEESGERIAGAELALTDLAVREAMTRERLSGILQSTCWQATAPLRQLADQLPRRARRLLQRGAAAFRGIVPAEALPANGQRAGYEAAHLKNSDITSIRIAVTPDVS
ncbi:glycosyltransferase family 2 protein [Paracraurococcus lichenis]|uniref:Glycosyltransferase n=1 Tax=Paracraurococcus lichenis TaxID=3064888 RepID=A0ABT9E980_9PROT|nr:glycosyltransferase [Paracraurococcus sp. LOR1-02]MDO9712500.1 glycosyltransferase [Paracraurococcus sp. LOR1-02]